MSLPPRHHPRPILPLPGELAYRYTGPSVPEIEELARIYCSVCKVPLPEARYAAETQRALVWEHIEAVHGHVFRIDASPSRWARFKAWLRLFTSPPC